MTFDELTQPQQLALVDIVARGGLYRMPAGYEGSLHQPHHHASMLALAKRGLCKLLPKAGCMGAVEPTATGRKVVSLKFNGTAYGALVVIVDATKKPRRKR